MQPVNPVAIPSKMLGIKPIETSNVVIATGTPEANPETPKIPGTQYSFQSIP